MSAESPRMVVFSWSIEIMGVFSLSLLKLNCLLRILNQKIRKVLDLRLIGMRIDLILMNPWPKGLVGMILLLAKVLYLERKEGGILNPSWQCNRVLVSFEGVSVEEFLDGFSKSKRTFSFAHPWK